MIETPHLDRLETGFWVLIFAVMGIMAVENLIDYWKTAILLLMALLFMIVSAYVIGYCFEQFTNTSEGDS